MKMVLSLLLIVVTTTLFSQTPEPPPPPLPDTLGERIFEKVDVEASFPGGETAWRKYLEKNLNPNVPVENGAPIGIYTVVAQFIVDKNGNISDSKVLTNFGYGMEEEVLRIIRKASSWTPASQNNRLVRAYRKQPITFVVEDDMIDIIMNEKYVLYTGIDNIIRINVDKVKNDNLEVSISPGTITRDDNGSFHIRVNNPGKAILNISGKKRNKELGSVYFIVKKKNK